MTPLDLINGEPRKMTITSWSGELPQPGEYMRSSGGRLYSIVTVVPTRPGSKSVARLNLLKLQRGCQLPAGQTCHTFAWNKRAPKKRCHERRP